MIIKVVNEFKPTVVHFARPNPMQIIYSWTKKLWKIRTRATGPLRRCGPWAAGLLLAKTLICQNRPMVQC